MKQGYGVFGAAYEVMLRNDPHDPRSIDHELLRRMVRLDPESYDLLYAEPPFCPHMEGHDLYGLAQTLKKPEDRASIETILAFTSGIAKKCETSLEKKRFGGTEQEILLEEPVTINDEIYMTGYTKEYVKAAIRLDGRDPKALKNTFVSGILGDFLTEEILLLNEK